jgi:short-chain Z-isoprenyl diphosphate synthase
VFVRPVTPVGRFARALLLAPVYGTYTRRLRHEVPQELVPKHVAVILDGNRRWASSSGLQGPGAGHKAGADKLDELIDWCAQLKIEQVTVWALASENMARTVEELAALLGVIADKLDLLAALHAQQSVRIRVFGRRATLPDRLRHSIEAVERMTADNDGLRLNIALGYSGRDELVDAVRALLRSLAASGYQSTEIADRITPETLAEHLYTAGEPDPDLDHPDERRAATKRVPALARHPQRAVLHRRLLARLSGARLPARHSQLPAAGAPIRPLAVSR